MHQNFAIIDANIARAKEGIRVLEDIVRFELGDARSSALLKNLRHGLAGIDEQFGSAHLIHARVRGKDVGVTIETESEHARSTLWDLVRANAMRVSEALRVLEEFSKALGLRCASTIKQLRYEVYHIEKEILQRTPHFWLKKYFEEGIVYPISDSVEELLCLVQKGAKIVQLRDKKSSPLVVERKARKICKALRPSRHTLFILNDHVELAAKLPVAGVHVGQEDTSISYARKMLGLNKIIGASNNSFVQMKKSVAAGADYASIGPVWRTPTKPERKPVGVYILSQVKKEIQIPWLAIGGIDVNNISVLRKRGVKNVAVVRSARKFF